MKVFVAGATGAIGRPLVRELIAHGHSVVGTTRSEQKQQLLWDLGAKPVVLDILDRDAVVKAIEDERPDAIVQQATALNGVNFMKFEKSFALTNRLRTEGTDNLIAAARAAGVGRIVAQSFAGWPHARVGGPVKSETDPLDPSPAGQTRNALRAILHLEAVVTEAGGTALRYGGFYGPGSGLEPGGEQLEMVRKRQFPIVGKGRAVWSFIHTEDAAAATVAALERPVSGIFNVVDDDPAPVSEWLPYLAELIGAKPPRRLPRWIGRLMGEHFVVMMDEARGASNAKARRELAWAPRYASWREGFAAVLSPTTSSSSNSNSSSTTTQPASNRSSSRSLSPS
jgi:nucleoside-diphosphate-sugar epimerase